MEPRPSGPGQELVLVGGGHAHVQVLKRLAMHPLSGLRTTLVVDRPVAVYSGMVPGFVAGQYAARELEIDTHVLARRAGARVIHAAATRVDAQRREIHVAGRPPIPYDLASLNVGSTVSGRSLPGLAELGLPSRPIGRFVARVDEAVRALQGRSPRILVVGGGAGGVELACALNQRLGGAQLTLVEASDTLLAGARSGLRARVSAALEARGVALHLGARALGARQEGGARWLDLEGGDALPFDLLVWVAGAAPLPLAEASDLPRSERGWVLTGPDLRVVGSENLFAVGDCAVQAEHRWVPRAGVYAVRQGAVLADNLEALVRGWGLRTYTPQKDFLTLVNLGDGTAIGARSGLSAEGAWVWRLKDRIDRRFMRRFQVLEGAGEPSPGTRPMPPEATSAMICGGCAAKVGSHALHLALSRLPPAPADEAVVLGLDDRDDVAAARSPTGDVAVTSIDAFRAFTDDPWLVGRVAAVNALSDLHAKGVAPRHALALVSVPDDVQARGDEAAAVLLHEVLAGARTVLDRLGVSLLGGHTTTAPLLQVGFSVLGWASEDTPLMPKSGLRAGDLLVLTKALGTGVLLHADPMGLVPGPDFLAALASMSAPNDAAMAIVRACGARVCTDVTGFGLGGHLAELTRASGCSAEVWLDDLPALPGALALLARGHRSTFHPENQRTLRAARVDPAAASHPALPLLSDPQTAGGLLFALPRSDAAHTLAALRDAGCADAAIVGRATPAGPDGAVFTVLSRAPEGEPT